MRLSSRRLDDADVIRARLRALLDESSRARGWLPGDEWDPDGHDAGEEEGPDRPPWALSPAPTGERDRAARGRGHPLEDPATDPDDPDEDAWPGGTGRHRAPGTAVRLDPGRRGARSLWVAGLLAALLLAGWTWLERPRVEPVGPPTGVGTGEGSASSAPVDPSVAGAAETAATVVVSVVGLVARPGLVTLPPGARVADALAAAGGLLPEADPASVNLAAVVADGQQIAVGVPGAPPAGGAVAPGGDPAGPVNLNAATVGDLDALPGIGPVLAQRIVAFREQQGRFTTVEQLDDVPGIGPAIYEQLKDLVAV